MKLAIISHTPHYKKDNTVSGWGPTIREINQLTEIFTEIYHIAPLHLDEPPASSMKYKTDAIKFVPLKAYGGKRLSDKISIFTTAIYNLKQIKTVIDKVDWVQFRAPTAMGLYVLPYLSLRKNPKRWVKYAGNWKMSNAPVSYRFQRWWLRKNLQHSKVTINGQWPDQESHIINFQNPCLDNNELNRAKSIANEKDFYGKLTVCFAGSLTRNKGVEIIIDALRKIKSPDQIKEIIFAGDGSERKRFEEESKHLNMKVTFKGFLNRTELEQVYEHSHLILLPSESEGFPKVIAEAAAYGCVPIVSDVSSISMYFNDSNGYLLVKIDSDELAEKIDSALRNRDALKKKSEAAVKVAGQFTFENYIRNLKEKILDE